MLISLKTACRQQMINITSLINQYLRENSLENGICLVFVPHTTAAVTINENADPTVPQDLLDKLERLIPQKDHYRHLEGNSDAHLKTILVGSSELIPVQNKKLQLGIWQGVFFCEFDGPRTRKVQLQFIPA